MKKILLCSLMFSVLAMSGIVEAAEDVVFRIIVNAENPIERLSAPEISKLFLKKVKQWKKSKETVLPVDLLETAPIRNIFSKVIHGKKIASIKAYWQKQIFSGRGVPPEEKRTEQEILRYISEHNGAIGYISADTDIKGYDVKTLDIIH